MSLRLVVGAFAFVTGLLSPIAKGQARPAAACTPEMLDVRVLPPVERAQANELHEVAIEFRNRSDAPCQMQEAAVRLLPQEGPDGFTDGPVTGREQSASEQEFSRRRNQLEPAETAHILVAWRSRPYPEYPQCVNRDGLAVSLRYDLPPFVKVDHLWMKVCDRAYVSGIRFGPYVGEPITEDWLQRLEVNASDFAPPPLVKPKAPHDSPIEIGPQAEREMLGDYFELFLDLPQPDPGCPFVVFRKREADGETRAYVNQCDEGRTVEEGQPRRESGKWTTRLMAPQIGLRPERTGRVEYEVISRIREDEKFAYAEAATSVMVQDPKLPELPEIDSVEECRANQLRPVRATVLHGGKWHDALVYEVTNTAGSACRLGGVPKISFSHPEGRSYSTVPMACPNCDDPLFKPRVNAWIDLEAGRSAHFILGATRYDTESPHWRSPCDVVEAITVTLRDGQTLTMPFGVGTCAGVTISAWRDGKYDGDPLNAAYETTLQKGVQGPVPEQCAREDFSKLGRPVMLKPSGGLQFGLSVSEEKISLGQPVTLHLWIDNATDKEASVMTCMTLDFFWAEQFDLYDVYGHRVVKKRETEQRSKPAIAPSGGAGLDCTGFWSCTRNFAIAIPVRACLNGKAEPPEYDFNRNLLSYYDLPPGVYYVVPRTSKINGNFCREVQPKVDPATLRDRLRIWIEQN